MFNESILFQKLKQYQKKENSVNFLIGLFSIISISVILLLNIVLSEMLFNFNSFIRTSLVFLFFILFLILFIKFLIHPFFKIKLIPQNERFLITSNKIGSSFPEIKDKLVNAIQLSLNFDEAYYSKSLVAAAIGQVEKITTNIDFKSAIGTKKVKQIIILSFIIVFSFALFSVSNYSFQTAFHRIINYSKDFITPAKFYFSVSPGNSKITKGENLSVKIDVIGEKPNKISLNFSDLESDYFENKILNIDSNFSFSYTFLSPPKSFKYFVSSENISSDHFSVKVINRPIIKNLKVKIIPPSYSKLPVQSLEDNGDISSLFGSKVEIELTASKPLAAAFVEFADSTQLKFLINNNKANLSFIAKKNSTYKIYLNDEENNFNLNPITYSINLFNDNLPEIKILKPEDNLSLSENHNVQTLLKIKDDFGFSTLTLNYRLSYSKYEQPNPDFQKIQIKIPDGLDVLVNYLWDVSNLNLVTEDVVSYFFEISDNDFISGPKSVRTAIQTIRIPSLNEIIAETDQEQRTNLTEMENVLKESEELKKDIEDLEKDLKSGKDKLSWNEQKKAENLINKQNQIQEKLENIQNNLDEIKNNLNENKLLSKETLDKYMELQKLFSELSNDEMKKAMDKLNETMKNLDKQAMQEALKNFKFNEEAMRENIERTLNLLKRVQIEQKIDEALKQIDELMKNQDEISDKLKNTNPSDKSSMEKLSNQQKDISKQLKDLEKNLADLQKKMNEFPKEMPTKEMEQLKESMEKDDLSKESEDASQEMMSGEMQEASKNQSKIKQSLSKTKSSLSKMKSQMMQNQMKAAMNTMRKIAGDLLDISKDQELLKNNAQNLNPNSPKLSEAKKEQYELLEELDRVIKQLSELSKKSFSVTPEMAQALGKAMTQMNQSLSNLENSNNAGSVQNQMMAMGSLNEAATQMNNMLQDMMQGGQGSGSMMSFMQRMQKLSAEQMAINQLTQQLMSGGQLSMEQQSQLQRLAGQQQAIQKSLDELNNEMRQSSQASKMIGDLSDAVKKMEEVVNELKQNKTNNETLKKQEKILTRLLDAQKSLNERDFEKKRESRPGDKNLSRQSPSDLLNEDKKTKIQIDLLKSLLEGYSKDYEVLIRKYFEALQELNQL